MTMQNIPINSRVFGQYFGQDFTGVVTSATCIGNYGRKYIVKLNTPMVTRFGSQTEICLGQDVRDDLQPITAIHWIDVEPSLQVNLVQE